MTPEEQAASDMRAAAGHLLGLGLVPGSPIYAYIMDAAGRNKNRGLNLFVDVVRKVGDDPALYLAAVTAIKMSTRLDTTGFNTTSLLWGVWLDVGYRLGLKTGYDAWGRDAPPAV